MSAQQRRDELARTKGFTSYFHQRTTAARSKGYAGYREQRLARKAVAADPTVTARLKGGDKVGGTAKPLHRSNAGGFTVITTRSATHLRKQLRQAEAAGEGVSARATISKSNGRFRVVTAADAPEGFAALAAGNPNAWDAVIGKVELIRYPKTKRLGDTNPANLLDMDEDDYDYEDPWEEAGRS